MVKIVYQADDGMIFESEAECLEHDRHIQECAWECLVIEFAQTQNGDDVYYELEHCCSDRDVARYVLKRAIPFLMTRTVRL